MPTSCNTHDYDGKLREKWFEMRPMLIERYLPNCLSFDDTLMEIEEWLNKKYFNVKRIGRARRSLKILTSQRRSNFDSKNDIDVEELLPILWNQVKNQNDIHNTFYEQLCDITGGSCSQGRSTRLFQFLFLFDLPLDTLATTTTTNTEQEKDNISISNEQKSIIVDDNSISISEQSEEKSKCHDQSQLQNDSQSQLHIEENTEAQQQSHEEQQLQDDLQTQLHIEEKPEEQQQQLQQEQKSDHIEQINSSSNKKE